MAETVEASGQRERACLSALSLLLALIVSPSAVRATEPLSHDAVIQVLVSKIWELRLRLNRQDATSGLQKGCFRVVPTSGGGHELLHDSGVQDGTIIILDQQR
jgi:hypothetical protein